MTETTREEKWYYSSRVPGGLWTTGSAWPSEDDVHNIMNQQSEEVKKVLDRRIIHEVTTIERTTIRMEEANED